MPDNDPLVALVEMSRRRDAELQREHSFLRSIIDSVSSMITVRDRAGCTVLANEAAARFHGMTVQALEGKTADELVTMPAGWREEDREVMESGKALLAEAEIQGADGQAHWLILTKVPLVNADGVADRVLSSAVDVTWRKRSEKALRASQEEYRRLADNSPEVIARFDHALRHTYINEYGARVYGRRPSEIIGKTNVDLGMPADKVAFWAGHFNAVLETGHQRTVDFEFDGPTYGHQFFSSLFVPEFDAEGQVESILAITRDVTEARLAERALAEREADLRDAVDRLAEADRRKDEFIAILSHELRNPLAPIRYALPLLGREHLGEAGDRARAIISRQVDHLTRLVDDLLDVSRITRGKIDLHREDITLGSVLTTAVEASSPALTAARHTLTVDVPPEPIWLHADAARIAQVVTNLLNNSVKYTPRGGHIELQARREGDRAVVRVRDNGIGIAPDALRTIFEMFRQVEQSNKAQGGLGIGLALVKRLVEMHGGTIEARSGGIGQGAEFSVSLPLAEQAPRRAGEPEAASSVADRRLKVLVVDDNADLVEMLALVVESAGHEVRKALDGQTALSAALSYRPHVVLLDLGLPLMHGLDVAREIRRRPEMAAVRLVALTGWGQTEDRRQTQDAGFDYHLTKPTDPADLQRLLLDIASDGPTTNDQRPPTNDQRPPTNN